MAGRGAAAGPTTYTLYPSDDGAVYAGTLAADGAGASAVTSGSNYIVGESNDGGGTGYEGFLAFDTSAVVGTITSATLSLWSTNDASLTDFTFEARLYDWGASITTADWRAKTSLGALTLVASRSTVGWSTSAYNVLTSEAAFLSGINQSGTTRLILNSSTFRIGTFANTLVFIASVRDSDPAHRPKLVIEAS